MTGCEMWTLLGGILLVVIFEIAIFLSKDKIYHEVTSVYFFWVGFGIAGYSMLSNHWTVLIGVIMIGMSFVHKRMMKNY
jgi:hypothetical protein